MHYKIIADSCCDYVQQGEDIVSFVTRVPLSIDLDGRTFIDDASLDCAAFLADHPCREFLDHCQDLLLFKKEEQLRQLLD